MGACSESQALERLILRYSSAECASIQFGLRDRYPPC